MRPSRRQLGAGAAALAGASLGPWPTFAQFGGGFSVSGKKGPFIRQVSGRKLGWTAGGAGSLGLATDAVNQGQYQQARLRMPQTEAAVAGLLASLGSRWPYARGAPPRVFILGVDFYNAYSLPDNSIVVSFGLLDHAGSDDEVAFVLGHEYSHLLLGHFSEAGTGWGFGGGSNLGQLFLVGAAMSAAGGWTGAAGAAARDADATSDLLGFLSGVTTEAPHNQKQEDEADSCGFDLCLAADYAAEDAAATVFDTIQADRVRRTAAEDALKTQLKAQLSQAVGKVAMDSILSGGFAGGDVRGAIFAGGARIAITEYAARNQGAAHRPPAERKKGIAQYSEEAYPGGAPLREEKKVWLQRIRASREYAQAKIAVGAVDAAMKARTTGAYPQATAAIATAMATTYRGAPMVLCEAARLHDDMGDKTGADRLFAQADASPDQTVDGAIDHVRMLYRAGWNDRALQLIDSSTARFGGDEKPFAALKIATLRQAGRQDDADAAYSHCMTWPDQGLRHDCALAAGKKPGDEKKKGGFPFPGIPHL